MKKLLPLFCFVILSSIGYSQVVPADMQTDWSKAGLQVDIPTSFSTVSITDYGASANDSIDDDSALQQAIVALGGRFGVVYFPAGEYNFSTSISLPDSVVIKGAGADSTTFIFDFGGTAANVFNVSGGSGGSFAPIASGYGRGSQKLVIAGASSLFAVADEIEIREANGAWDIEPISWADYSVGHLATVEDVSGDTLWIDEALRIDFTDSLNPEIRVITPRQFCGFECFKMVKADNSPTGISYGVSFSMAKNCWVRGVESEKSVCAHVAIETSSHISITESYFHEAYEYTGSGTRGYGVVILAHATSNLVQNNTFRMLRHSMMAKQGANGNVFGYNYSLEPNRSEPIPDYGADLCLHGHFPFANLFEGNIAQNLNIDIVWGPSGPYNMFFRNKLENYGIIMSSGSVQSDRQIFVGNDVTSTGLGKGNNILYGSGHFLYGNNIRGAITPAATNQLTDTSYYLSTSRPAFWNLQKRIPTVGTPNDPSDDNNPARQRYTEGGLLALCELPELPVDSTITDTTTAIADFSLLTQQQIVFGKSEDNNLHIIVASSSTAIGTIRLWSINGQLLASERIRMSEGRSSHIISLSAKPASGVYFVQLQSSRATNVYRLYVE